MIYSLIIWSKQIIAITILLWVQLHEEIWLSDKIFHLVNIRKKYIPWPSANNILQRYTKSKCVRQKKFWLAATLQVLKAMRAAKFKPPWLTLCLPAILWASLYQKLPFCHHCHFTYSVSKAVCCSILLYVSPRNTFILI